MDGSAEDKARWLHQQRQQLEADVVVQWRLDCIDAMNSFKDKIRRARGTYAFR